MTGQHWFQPYILRNLTHKMPPLLSSPLKGTIAIQLWKKIFTSFLGQFKDLERGCSLKIGSLLLDPILHWALIPKNNPLLNPYPTHIQSYQRAQ